MLSISTLFLLFLTGCSEENKRSAEEEVENLVSNYLEAVETKDIPSMIKYADDIRFPDKKEQEKEYANIDYEIMDTKVVAFRKVSESKFEAIIEFVEDEKLTNMTVPIEKLNKEWRIIVGQDVEL